MSKKFVIDVERLLKACGGAGAVHAVTGLDRTNLYSAIRRNRLTSDQMASIMHHYPTLNARDFVKEVANER